MNNLLSSDGGSFFPMKINLVPGKRADPFVLGADIRDVLKIVSSPPWNEIVTKTVIKYDLGAHRNCDVLFDLSENGVLLRFSSHTQKLIAVEIYDFERIQLSFCGEVFGGGSSSGNFGQFDDYQMSSGTFQAPLDDSYSFRDGSSNHSQIPTFAEIYRLFRPTYPGSYEFRDDLITYTLNYPGISFIFLIPEKWRDIARQQQEKRDHPNEFPDHSSPRVIRICLSEPVDAIGQADSEVPASEGTADGSSNGKDSEKNKTCVNSRKQNVEVRFLDGLYFDDGTVLKLGDSAQDVVSILGEPEEQFLKPRDQMKGYSSHSGSAAVPPQDLFYNYFGCGIDVLLDGKTFTVKKFVLHANYPHHKDFGRYSKSIWRASVHPEGASSDDGINRDIGVDSAWSEVKTAFTPYETSRDPLLNSASSVETPFGTTYFHACEPQCAIFEVMENGFIASMSFFRP